jgi:hypothetical protein
MKTILVFILMMIGVAANSAGNISKPQLTISQSRTLVYAALTLDQLRAPGIFMEKDNIPSYPGFLIFHVMYDAPPEEGGLNIGFYAVDPFTGDVFDTVAECLEYKNKKLAMLQKKYRREILNLTQNFYMKIKTKGPMCEK